MKYKLDSEDRQWLNKKLVPRRNPLKFKVVFSNGKYKMHERYKWFFNENEEPNENKNTFDEAYDNSVIL